MYCPKCGNFNEDTAVSCSECNANLSSINSPNNGQLPYAGFWIRFAARFIDGVFLYIFGLIIGVIAGVLFQGSLVFILLSSIIVGISYFAGFESSEKQATIGKQVVGIKVIDYEGNRISFGKAVVRSIVKDVTALMLGIGYIAIPFSEKKQGLYDMAAETFVVYK
ncbi:RDD family protein [Methanolobus sp. WCC1]|uniref:Putative membrane protein/domain n=1 Tax=Methanolobus tindarius DSM 2278 TaxID=1090322 RepID=W9DQY7_METTI|nr:RDD family protein [Methanolobus tindarius]ETA68013.1 putative membrane protein/domain [Methanolobus tindarius DSM 2278]